MIVKSGSGLLWSSLREAVLLLVLLNVSADRFQDQSTNGTGRSILKEGG